MHSEIITLEVEELEDQIAPGFLLGD